MPDNEEKTAKGEDVVIKGAKVEAPVYEVKGGTVLIEERLSELERITKVLENWRKEDKKENRKWLDNYCASSYRHHSIYCSQGNFLELRFFLKI